MTRRVIHSGRAATCGPSALDDEENQLADWDWQVFCRDTIDGEARPSCFGAGGDITYLDWMLSAWGWTASVSLLALAVAMLFGCLMGILRTTPNRWLVLLGDAWTELFRNIPVLVQVFLWYFVVPELVPVLKQIPSFLLVVLGLGFFTSARVSEQVKAGIQSLPRGQRMAGQALGLTLPQTYRHVLLPSALRIVIPPLTSESMGIVKNSSVAFSVSVAELTMFARQAQEETSRGIEIYLAVTALYFITSILVYQVARLIEQRLRIPGTIGAGKCAAAKASHATRLFLPERRGHRHLRHQGLPVLAAAHAGGDGRRHRAVRPGLGGV